MNSEEENVWVIEAKLLTGNSQRMEEIVQELEDKGFFVRKRSIVFDN
ncbi:MAG: hypothetical protein ACOCSC_03475 [Candidatus Hadarchaeota archaeon]